MKKTATIFASLALVGLLAVGAWAGQWGPGGGPGRGPGWGAGPGGKAMTQEEYKQYQSKLAAFMKETLPMRQQMVTKGMEIRTLQMQPDADQAKIKALTNEVIDLKAQIAKKANDAGLSGRMGMGGFGGGHRGMRGGGPRGGGYGPGACWQ